MGKMALPGEEGAGTGVKLPPSECVKKP